MWRLHGVDAALHAAWQAGRRRGRNTPRHPAALTVHAISLRPATVDDAEQRAYLADQSDLLERVRVLAVNHRAYRLYRRLGFTEISRDGVAPEVRIRTAVGP